MKDRVLPIALIAIGLIWLLFATGFVPPALGVALARYWPLLLIGAGLDIWIPERRPLAVFFTAWAGALILLLAVFMPGGGTAVGDQEVYRALPEDAQRVTFDVSNGSAEANVRTTRLGQALVNARFTGEPRGRVSISEGRNPTVRIEPEGEFFSLFTGRTRWDIEVPGAVPLDVRLDGGSGPLVADLSGARVESLSLDVGSGPSTLVLPGGGTPYRVEVDGGSGPLTMSFAPGSSVDMTAELGSGPTVIRIGEGTDMRLSLDTGSGPLELDLPDSAPIRLTIQDDGSGPLSLPRFLERRSGRGDTGVWESSNLSDGGRVVDVTLEDVGSGPVTIR